MSIMQRLGLTNKEIVEQIRKNTYMQYVVSFGGYSGKEANILERVELVELNRICELITEAGKGFIERIHGIS